MSIVEQGNSTLLTLTLLFFARFICSRQKYHRLVECETVVPYGLSVLQHAAIMLQKRVAPHQIKLELREETAETVDPSEVEALIARNVKRAVSDIGKLPNVHKRLELHSLLDVLRQKALTLSQKVSSIEKHSHLTATSNRERMKMNCSRFSKPATYPKRRVHPTTDPKFKVLMVQQLRKTRVNLKHSLNNWTVLAISPKKNGGILSSTILILIKHLKHHLKRR